MGTSEFNSGGGNLAIDWDPIQRGVELTTDGPLCLYADCMLPLPTCGSMSALKSLCLYQFRRSQAVLKKCLPSKEEHIILVNMSPIQRELYNTFVEQLLGSVGYVNPIKDFHTCTKVSQFSNSFSSCKKVRQRVTL